MKIRTIVICLFNCNAAIRDISKCGEKCCFLDIHIFTAEA